MTIIQWFLLELIRFPWHFYYQYLNSQAFLKNNLLFASESFKKMLIHLARCWMNNSSREVKVGLLGRLTGAELLGFFDLLGFWGLFAATGAENMMGNVLTDLKQQLTEFIINICVWGGRDEYLTVIKNNLNLFFFCLLPLSLGPLASLTL